MYLTPTGEGPSKCSVSGETIEELKGQTPRRLVIMPCGSSGELDDTFKELRLSNERCQLFSLADWLADCRRGCDLDRLRWFLREAETFCQRQYGGTTMTTTENNTVKDFILADRRNVETALAVYQSWPDVAEKIKRDFLKSIYDKLEKDPGLPKATWDYGKGNYRSYIYIFPESWPQYRDPDGQEAFTTICMEAQGKGGSNWVIGVSRSTSKIHEDDTERWQRLRDAFAECGKQTNEFWLWWEWIEDEYRDWDALTPRLHQECDKGGKITDYFVEKFKRVLKEAKPIIDGR